MCSDFATRQKTARSSLGHIADSLYRLTSVRGFSHANLKFVWRGSVRS